jgi:arylformamidase
MRDYNAEFNTALSVPERPQILERWQKQGAATRARTAGHLNMRYGRRNGETLDFYPATGRTDKRGAPLLIFIHGGWFRALDKDDFSWIAPPYMARGINVALPNYGLAPALSVREITQQMLRAMAYLHLNAGVFGFDRKRIVVAGHSAGAHLAAMMLAAQWPDYLQKSGRPVLPQRMFSAGVLVSGVFDLQPVLTAPFINDDLKLNEDTAFELSPAFMPPASDAPVITAVGGEESRAFVEQTRLLNTRWSTVFKNEVPMPAHNHFTVCDAFADPAEPLFEATMDALG